MIARQREIGDSMIEGVMLGFCLDSFGFYRRNFPEVEVVGYVGEPLLDGARISKAGTISFDDYELYSETRGKLIERAVTQLRNCNFLKENIDVPVLLFNSFMATKEHYESIASSPNFYYSEARVSKSAFVGVNTFFEPGVIVGENAYVSHSVNIQSLVRIRENSVIGALTSVGKRCYIAQGVSIGKGVVIEDDVTIPMGTVIPDGTTVRPGDYG